MEIHSPHLEYTYERDVGFARLTNNVEEFLKANVVFKKLIITYNDVVDSVPYVNLTLGTDKNIIRDELLHGIKTSWLYSLNSLRNFQAGVFNKDKVETLYEQVLYFATAEVNYVKDYAIKAVCRLLVCYIEATCGCTFKDLIRALQESEIKVVPFLPKKLLWFILNDAIEQLRELLRSKGIRGKQALTLTLNNRKVLIHTMAMLNEYEGRKYGK